MTVLLWASQNRLTSTTPLAQGGDKVIFTELAQDENKTKATRVNELKGFKMFLATAWARQK